jgi:hypothetical protein
MILEGVSVGNHTDPLGLYCIDVNDVCVSGFSACLPLLLKRPILNNSFIIFFILSILSVM